MTEKPAKARAEEVTEEDHVIQTADPTKTDILDTWFLDGGEGASRIMFRRKLKAPATRYRDIQRSETPFNWQRSLDSVKLTRDRLNAFLAREIERSAESQRRCHIRRVGRFRWRVVIVQSRWRIDWRTPPWLPIQFVLTLRRWL